MLFFFGFQYYDDDLLRLASKLKIISK